MVMFESFEYMKATIEEVYYERLKINNSTDESDLSRMLRAALMKIPNKKVPPYFMHREWSW